MDNTDTQINTGGGANVDGNVDTGGGTFIGRDENIHGDQVGQDKVMHDKYVVYPGGVVTVGGEPIRLPTADDVDAYLQAIQQAYARWADQPDEPDLPLARQASGPDSGPDAFIPLRALPMRVARFVAQPGGQPPPAQDLLAALANAPRAIVLGEPGSGKSTALERIAWATASQAVAQLPGQPAPVPILVPLSSYRGQPDLLPAIDQALKLHGLRLDNLASLRKWLEHNDEQIVLLLDGLNELRQEHRQDGHDAIRRHIVDRPQQTIRLTCRTADFDDKAQAEPTLQVLPQAQIWTVEPLVDDIRYWDDGEGHSDVRDYLRLYLGAADGKRLWDKIHADDRLRTLARLPLFLWMLKETAAGGGELPADRGGLVQRFVRSPRVWARSAHGVRERTERGLERLGWRLQELGSLVIDSDELDAVLESAAGRRATLVELDAALRSTGLLIDQHDGTHKLLHQLIQEYAAAAYLTRLQDCPERLAALAQDGDWRETAIMALWLRADLHNPAYLQGLMGEPAVDLRVRIAAATILAQVGDPRFVRQPHQVKARSGGPATRTVHAIEPAMVAIPAGRALLGGEDPDADSDELPQSPVQVAAFELAVYPVTNAEFACFLEDRGYEQLDLWTPAGQAWLAGEGKLDAETEDALRRQHRWLRSDLENILADWRQSRSPSDEEIANWRGIATLWTEDDFVEAYNHQILSEQRREPFLWRDSRFNALTQPVVGVNWYEVSAYAAWLARVTGTSYRLPTEAEWEWAARRNVRRYAWNGDWDPARCNSSESRLGQPSPVGVYPHGATPDGLHDLSGNVYEWTATLFRPYRYDPADGREDPLADGLRVMRGGSWYVARTNVRCSYRHRLNPRGWYIHLGYRLARSLE
jgi:formylglycine-generating enzyme required for sulfatase activity